MPPRPFSLPAYNVENAMVNFAPVNEALTGYTRGIETAGRSTAQINAANAMASGNFDLAASETARSGDVSGAMALRRHPMEVTRLQNEERDREVRRLAGRLQPIIGMPDGPERAAAWRRLIDSDPRWRRAMEDQGMDINDHMLTPQAIHAEAIGPVDPLTRDNTRSQIALREAQAEQARAHATLYRAQSTEGRPPPAGFEWVNPQDRSQGLRAIPGGPGTHISAEVAGRLALMDTARPGVAAARQIYERAWGITDFARQGAGNIPFVGDLAIASGEQGIAQRNVRTAIEAALRVMTGAAAPEAEVTRYMAMFMPGARDTIESARQKLDALEGFMEQARALATLGRSSTPPPAGGGASAAGAGSGTAPPDGRPGSRTAPVLVDSPEGAASVPRGHYFRTPDGRLMQRN